VQSAGRGAAPTHAAHAVFWESGVIRLNKKTERGGKSTQSTYPAPPCKHKHPGSGKAPCSPLAGSGLDPRCSHGLLDFLLFANGVCQRPVPLSVSLSLVCWSCRAAGLPRQWGLWLRLPVRTGALHRPPGRAVLVLLGCWRCGYLMHSDIL
jgi:hypothetical protein